MSITRNMLYFCNMEKLKLYAITLGKALVAQIIGVLGIFFAFGFVLSKIQDATARVYMRSVGWKGILWTAWIGTPVHELGHAFFAKIFRHKIHSLNLFQPNERTGALGHVDHSIGNFFIGAAPMIWGSVILVLILYFFVPNGRAIFSPLMNDFSSFTSLFKNIKETLANLLNPENFNSWKFWVFVYISFCISSHLAPSPADQKGMWRGFFWLVFILTLINAFALLLKVNITEYILKVNQYLGIFTAVFVYALIISIAHFIIASVLLFPFRRR